MAESNRCVDDPEWKFDVNSDLGCKDLKEEMCEEISHVVHNDKTVDVAWYVVCL